MTKQEMLDELIGYDSSPDSPRYCDALCTVADALGLDDDREYTSEELRALVEGQDFPGPEGEVIDGRICHSYDTDDSGLPRPS